MGHGHGAPPPPVERASANRITPEESLTHDPTPDGEPSCARARAMSPALPPGGGRCGCGAAVHPDSFRDRLSWRELHITGRCQACQDRLFFAASAHDAHRLYPVRRGVIAATVTREGAVVELGLLPFLFIAPEARIAFEPRYLLRAGAALAPLDPFDALRPVRSALGTHQVRLVEVADVHAPEVRDALDVDLAVAGDAAARAALAGLALPPGARSSAQPSPSSSRPGRAPARRCRCCAPARCSPSGSSRRAPLHRARRFDGSCARAGPASPSSTGRSPSRGDGAPSRPRPCHPPRPRRPRR